MNERQQEQIGLPIHFYKTSRATGQPTVLMLHGVGGQEHDLLPIATRIAPKAGLLGVRGRVLENGLARYFSRVSSGEDQQVERANRTTQMLTDLDDLAHKYAFDRSHMLVIGYSEGADMALSLLGMDSHKLCAAILLHPCGSLQQPCVFEQTVPVFVSSGKIDTANSEMTTRLIKHLGHAGARVTPYWTTGGHQLNRLEIDEACSWYRREIGKP